MVMFSGEPGDGETAPPPVASTAAKLMMSTDAQSSLHGHSFGTVACWVADVPVMALTNLLFPHGSRMVVTL